MKEPCPKCREEGKDDSGDNLHRYSDGHAHCFSCGYRETTKERKEPMSRLTIGEVETYPYGTDPSRKISSDVAALYGVRHSVSPTTGEPDTVYYPHHDTSGNITGYKVRKLPKDFRPSVAKIGLGLFGRNTCRPTANFLYITEGEEDCMAVAQMVRSSSVDVVSLPNGAGLDKGLVAETELISQYKRVYLHLDNDDAGKKALPFIADFLAPFVEVRVVETMSDPSELLKSGEIREFKRAVKDATIYEPEGIVSGNDLDLSIFTETLPEGYPIPFKGVQEKLHGLRKGEILTVCAGSGIGKSTFVRECTLSLIKQGLSVANVALEDRMEDAAKHLVALDMNIPFHSFKFHPPPIEDQMPHIDDVIRNNRTYFYKHFAGITADSLMNKLYYYARSKAVDFIVLDHLSMVISSTETQNERKAIDTLMTNLAKMVVETGVGLIQIVHLRRTGGEKSFAKGGEVELTDLRGSAALEQLSWGVIGLERDQQGDSRDFSRARVLKNRTYGFTGLADHLKYDAATGRMHSIEPDDIPSEDLPDE